MMYIRPEWPAYQHAGVKKVDRWFLYIKQSIRAEGHPSENTEPAVAAVSRYTVG